MPLKWEVSLKYGWASLPTSVICQVTGGLFLLYLVCCSWLVTLSLCLRDSAWTPSTFLHCFPTFGSFHRWEPPSSSKTAVTILDYMKDSEHTPLSRNHFFIYKMGRGGGLAN